MNNSNKGCVVVDIGSRAIFFRMVKSWWKLSIGVKNRVWLTPLENS